MHQADLFFPELRIWWIFFTPGSEIRNRFLPDHGSRIITLYFWEFSDKKFWKRKLFLILSYLWLQKKEEQKNFSPPLLLLYCYIRDSGSGKNQDLGSGINIPDPQHWNFFPWKPLQKIKKPEEKVLKLMKSWWSFSNLPKFWNPEWCSELARTEWLWSPEIEKNILSVALKFWNEFIYK